MYVCIYVCIYLTSSATEKQSLKYILLLKKFPDLATNSSYI